MDQGKASVFAQKKIKKKNSMFITISLE